MPLQDPSLIASTSKPSVLPSSLTSQQQNPLPTNLSPCLIQSPIQPLPFENLRNHPLFSSQEDVERTNTGIRVTLDALMNQGGSMVFTLDSTLAHTYHLFNHARETFEASKSRVEGSNAYADPKQDASFVVLQELQHDMEQLKAILVDHGNSMVVLEAIVYEVLQRQGDTEARMGRFEKIIGDVGKAVSGVGKAVGYLHSATTSGVSHPHTSSIVLPSQTFTPTPFFTK